MTIELIYPFFILTGLVIVSVLIYLRYLTQNAMRTILEMIELNATLEYDLHQFLPKSRTLLKKLKIDDIFYSIHYLNTTIQRSKSNPGKQVEKIIQREDYQITVGIAPRHSRGEQDFLNMIVLEILSILIEMNILIKIKVIHEALYKFSKLQTFLLHDVKNLAQFIGSLSYNVHHLETLEKKDRFIDYLKETLPVISRSGAKIIGLLEMQRETDVRKSSQQNAIDLNSLLENLAKHYNLPHTINGVASIFAEEYMVISIFDNLLKNIYDKCLQEPDITCHMDIIDLKSHIKIVISDTGSLIADRNRLFEPFYSTKKGGLGIGLYQAKNVAEALGGDICILPHVPGVAFEVTLPTTQEV
jgi:signal transduction histidine kinase